MVTTIGRKPLLRAVVGLGAWALLLAPACAREKEPAITVVQEAQSEAGPAQASQPGDLASAIVAVAKKAIPAVAHIEVTERKEVENPFGGFGMDPFFQRFFGMPGGGPRKFQQLVKGLGSGVVLDKDGYIVTNAHVVAGATKIEVQLASGEKHEAKVVGIDSKTDLAVIKIPGRADLPFLQFGDSDRLEVGQWVVAIGHPRGLDQTVTQGIISAKHRRGISDPSNYQDFLQTDAAINPGNSGGPLLDLSGRVIGINAMIASQSGGSEGIGFAIPCNMAVHVAQQLIAKGKVERGYLGVTLQDLTPDIARSLGLKVTEGALVADVAAGGPAQAAGIKRGDVVTTYRGEPIHDSGSLRNKVGATAAGDTVELKVLRKGKEMVLKVKTSDLAEATRSAASSTRGPLGVAVRPIKPAETSRYGLDPQSGVVITDVDPKGPLGKEGIEVDDVLLQINGNSLSTLDDFVQAMSSLQKGQKVLALVLDHRTGNSGYVQALVP